MINDSLILTLPEKFAKYYGFLDNLVSLSQHINETNIKLLAGIVILLLGTEKIKPIKTKAKYIYFILFPALASLLYSFYLGTKIQEESAKVRIINSFSYIRDAIHDRITQLYIDQGHYMNIGVVLTALWLIIYFAYWFFNEKE